MKEKSELVLGVETQNLETSLSRLRKMETMGCCLLHADGVHREKKKKKCSGDFPLECASNCLLQPPASKKVPLKYFENYETDMVTLICNQVISISTCHQQHESFGNPAC
jgi:hypothetical protein